MLGYAIAAPNLQNYGSQGRPGLECGFSLQNRNIFAEYLIKAAVIANKFNCEFLTSKLPTFCQVTVDFMM
ncbi:hypothetical protein A6V25_07900 [Nostoc sp. ATCC 53789]|nr:hypothetical protein A6V25_07900 [Nostoc sp. ATCC 53789]